MSSKGGGKRTPRRLFSFDSSKNSSTTSVDSSDNDRPQTKHGKFPTLDQVAEIHEGKTEFKPPRAPFGSKPSSRPSSPGFREKGSHLALQPVASHTTVFSEGPQPPSPSRARWDHLRQHVISPSVVSTPPYSHSNHPSASSSSLSSQTRSGTPKPSKIAQKLGFRQVVDQSREMYMDQTRKLGYELQKACWASRYYDMPSKAKADVPYGHTTTGSSLYLPFMSSHSLAATSNSIQTSQTANAGKRTDLRRPQSISLPPTAHPTLKPLYQILNHHSNPPSIPHLPIESEILSTMLGPFLTLDKGSIVDEETWYAVESFEILTTAWRPDNENVGLQRCVWCIEAAMLMPAGNHRTRLLTLLWSLLVPPDTFYTFSAPKSLCAIIEGLFTLLASSQSLPHDTNTINDIVMSIRRCSNGAALDQMLIEEEYNALFVDDDDAQIIREAVILEGVVMSMNSSESSCQWIFQSALQGNWPLPQFDKMVSPLLGNILNRRIKLFLKVLHSLLRPNQPRTSGQLADLKTIVTIMDTRIIPEVQSMSPNIAVLENRRDVVVIAFILLTFQDLGDARRWPSTLISHWYLASSEWKTSVEQALKYMMSGASWLEVVELFVAILQKLSDDVRQKLVPFVTPLFNEKLVETPPSYPCAPLANLMDTLSHVYPQIFYKPLFLCAASTKEFAVINHLSSMAIAAKFLPDYWFRDAEMTAIAIGLDYDKQHSSNKAKKDTPSPAPRVARGTARLGQSVLLLELVSRIQAVRREKDDNTCSDDTIVMCAKFSISLEARLNVLLNAKETSVLLPPSQRLLFIMLFREIRLLTRSNKPAPWLPRTLSWFIDSHNHDSSEQNYTNELSESVLQLQGLYAAAQNGFQASQRRSTKLFSPDSLQQNNSTRQTAPLLELPKLFDDKTQLLKSLSKGLVPRAMKLLVSVSVFLTVHDCKRLGPLIWDECLDGSESSTLSSACFLIMQCAEKAPSELLTSMEVDMQSSNALTRLSAVKKISKIVSWRFQIMDQNIVNDRSRRPFKFAKGPLPFVALDMGSPNFIQDEDNTNLEGRLPAELRKRLAEIGWEDSDEPVDYQQQWIATPMALLPSSQLDKLDVSIDIPPSPSLSPTPTSSPQRGSPVPDRGGDELSSLLLRRNSSTGGPLYGAKRRSIFVPTLSQIFPRLLSLLIDDYLAVSVAARNAIMDIIRNDPALITRPVFDLLYGEHKNIPMATLSLRAFFHIRHCLPPLLTYSMMNHIAGWLKYLTKDTSSTDSLHDYSRILPIMSTLISQVSDMSLRELRRSKVEPFFVPTGQLWFSESAPNGPMFPREKSYDNPFEDLPGSLVSVTMIRISQNKLLLAILKRNPQDVQLVRKSVTQLILPLWDEHPLPLALKSFIPSKLAYSREIDPIDAKVKGISLLLARTHVPLVAQIFRSMSRHLNDRDELAILIDGLNRILLEYGNDIGIVSHVLIALMVASTRFRRLFSSFGAYALFMPAIIKVYTESERHRGIRLAIEYAVNRFYAHHRESFVFQTLDAMSHIIVHPAVDGDWVAKNVHTLFSTLRKGVITSLVPDAAGIHDANKLQEQEALMISTAEEKPQTLLASLRRNGVTTQSKEYIPLDIPQEYVSNKLSLDDFVRLFLTVIAHDLTITRAEYFMKFLSYMTPYLYHSSATARNVLEDGIDALGQTLVKMSTKLKGGEPLTADLPGGEDERVLKATESYLLNQSKKPGDMISMQLNYLSMIISFTTAGGMLSAVASRRLMELVKVLLRDSPRDINGPIASFLDDYMRTSLLYEKKRSVKAVNHFLKDISPIVSAYALTVDFSGVFDCIQKLCSDAQYASDKIFASLVVQICSSGLKACELAASDGLSFSLPCRVALVSLLADCIFLRSSDVLAEVEKIQPTYGFLSAIITPLVISMKTRDEVELDSIRSENWQRDAQSHAWARLLSYTMSACEYRTLSVDTLLERSKSNSGAKNKCDTQLPLFISAIQTLKIIIIKGEKDLTTCLPDVWSRISRFLKSILSEGNANFAVMDQDSSPAATPSHSPRNSFQLYASFPEQTYASPRFIDYCLWSFLELMCMYRTPLVIQLRLLIQENVINLDRQLRQMFQRQHAPTDHRRISTSIFTKPRRLSSVYGTPSLGSSPMLNSPPSLFDLGPGYHNIVPTSNSSPHGKPQILHLGLVTSPSLPSGPYSPGGPDSVRRLAKSTNIASLSLIRRTYQRIRTVQLCMGYQSTLLPIPNPSDITEEDQQLKAWTTKDALEQVLSETRGLLQELDETFTEEDSMVMVNVDQSFSV